MADYTVQPGDCISTIAEAHGYLWNVLWNHGSNAALKSKRKDGNILNPGDVVVIPDVRVKLESANTEQRHRFTKKENKVLLNLRLLEEDQPRSGVNYTLKVEGLTFTGQTDGNGEIKHNIPVAARTAKLTTAEESYDLKIGDLNPISENSGVQQRLRNLAYTAENPDGTIKDSTKGAIKEFKKKNSLGETDALDDATRSKLKESHGC